VLKLEEGQRRAASQRLGNGGASRISQTDAIEAQRPQAACLTDARNERTRSHVAERRVASQLEYSQHAGLSFERSTELCRVSRAQAGTR